MWMLRWEVGRMPAPRPGAGYSRGVGGRWGATHGGPLLARSLRCAASGRSRGRLWTPARIGSTTEVRLEHIRLLRVRPHTTHEPRLLRCHARLSGLSEWRDAASAHNCTRESTGTSHTEL